MSATAARVRPVSECDLDRIAEIHRHYVVGSIVTFEETPPDRAEWAERRRRSVDRGLPFLVAELDGDVVGYAYATAWRMRPAYRHTAEESVYVAPEATGRGVGRRLLGEVVHRCLDGQSTS